MVVDLGFMLLNGKRKGDILPFLVIPSVAVVILGPKKSRPWFVACFLVMLIVPIIDGYLPEISLTLNQTLITPTGSLFHSPLKRPLEICEGLTMTVGTLFIYFLIYSGYRKLEAARELIEVQKAQIEHEFERFERFERLLENILPRQSPKG